jgi:TonB family protein
MLEPVFLMPSAGGPICRLIGLSITMAGLWIATTAGHEPQTPNADPTWPYCDERRASVSESHGPDPVFDNAYASGTPALSLPVLKEQARATYPRQAMDTRICGTVTLEGIVLADGKVGAVRVVESLDKVSGLDDHAMETVRQWRFVPGRLGGKAVPVRMTIKIGFELRARPIHSYGARENIGVFAVLCETVHTIGVAQADVGGVRFAFGKASAPSLTILIPPETAAQFQEPPTRFDGHSVCVTGPIDKVGGLLQITVTRRDQLALDASAGNWSGTGDGTGGGAYRSGYGIVDPVLVRSIPPSYTREAQSARIQGDVELEGIVQPNGRLSDIRITKSLDPEFGLDQEAVKCVKQWLFRPGTKEGQPVPVWATLVIQFRLHI